MAGDSTLNDGNAPPRKALLRLGQLTQSGVGMQDQQWSTSTNAYAAPTVVKSGTTTPSVGGTVLTDNFNRVAAELVGSTTSGGQVWAGATGGWSSDGTVTTANSGISSLGFHCGTKSITSTAQYNIVTTSPAASSQARLAVGTTQANFAGGGSYVWAQLLLSTAGALSVSVWKRISGTPQTELISKTPVTGVTSNTATIQPITLKLDIAIQAVTLTMTVNGANQVLTTSVTEADTGILGTFSGVAMPANASGSFKLDNITMATRFTAGTYTGLEIWNAAVGGTGLSYQKDRLATMYPTATKFDWLLVSGGHNFGTQTPEAFIADVDAFITAFRAAHPETLIVVSSQNPQLAPATTITAHARRQAALRDYAMGKGFEYLPVFEAFTNQPDGGASLVNPADSIHPTVSTTTDITTWCGNLLWTAVWLNVIASRRQTVVIAPITALP
ncbi:SGNH/GDSL hydrolase family protein [Arthrobacter sp. B1805]|uniref:SGNH/GDSL hydrolase family protein n=1 Tax=Arthrobacter sp. B1805 TaxID=2058892 RepID=UPI000CE2F13F|nr:SGNH/GDSL hydrolase family protein [Arthrobacter sp. B1805]